MLLMVAELFVGSRRRQAREIAFKSPHTSNMLSLAGVLTADRSVGVGRPEKQRVLR